MLRREVEKDLLAYCRTHDIGVVAYSPMASGLLTGKFDFEKLAHDDWRRNDMRFNEEGRAKVTKLLEQLKPIALQNKISLGELAVAWVLRNDNITSAIVGARKSWQIEEVVGASEVQLAISDIVEIEKSLRSF